jgi:hypothetical protein
MGFLGAAALVLFGAEMVPGEDRPFIPALLAMFIFSIGLWLLYGWMYNRWRVDLVRRTTS